MKGLDQNDHQVGRRKAAAIGRGLDPDHALGLSLFHEQTVPVDRVYMGLVAIDKCDIGARCCERAANRAAQGTCAQKIDFQFVSVLTGIRTGS